MDSAHCFSQAAPLLPHERSNHHVNLPACAQLHLRVVRSCNQNRSSVLAGKRGDWNLSNPGSCHFLISEWPSAKERPPAPLWYAAGVSTHSLIVTSQTNHPSLMLVGDSSTVTHHL